MAVDDWSTTAGSNTSIDGVNIDEGCSPAGINNAIRSIMAAVKAKFDNLSNTFALLASPIFTTKIEVHGGVPRLRLRETDGNTDFNSTHIRHAQDSLIFQVRDDSDNLVETTYTIRYDASGATEYKWNVGSEEVMTLGLEYLTTDGLKITGNTANAKSDISMTSNAVIAAEGSHTFTTTDADGYFRYMKDASSVDGGTAGATEVFRIDDNGDVTGDILANQTQAENGNNAARLMTPERTKQAIDAQTIAAEGSQFDYPSGAFGPWENTEDKPIVVINNVTRSADGFGGYTDYELRAGPTVGTMEVVSQMSLEEDTKGTLTAIVPPGWHYEGVGVSTFHRIIT